MRAAALLAELRAAGICLAVEGERLVARGRGLPPDLTARLRERKAELVALLTARKHPRNPQIGGAEPAAGNSVDSVDGVGGAPPDDACLAYAAVTSAERARIAAEAAADPLARLVLAASPSATQAAPVSAPAGPWRVIIDFCAPRPGPIHLNAWTTITDSALAIERDLADLTRAVADRNAGRSSAFTLLADEYLVRLTACGAVVRVEVLQ